MTIKTLLAAIGMTFIFSLAFYETLFAMLNYFEIKYEKRTKRKILWLIFYGLLSLATYFYLLQLLLFQ